MNDVRAFEMTIEIAVSPDALWQAITDPDDLVRWFATEADVTPAAGGQWIVSWDGKWPWNTSIEIWEPQRHLRLLDRQSRPYDAHGQAALESVAPMPVAIDWHVEGHGGTTVLRLVHSGFGRGGAWDDEFAGVSVGWHMELNALKHYLERHRGEARQVAWTRAVAPASPAAVWRRLTGADGLLPAGSLSLNPGDPYDLTLSTGDRLEGTVVNVVPGRGLQVRVAAWNDALYRLWIDCVGDESAINSWLTTYGMPAAFASAFDARMRAEIDRVAAAAVA
jgi:uncharacterized protein YndB with AHSA1/START domain